MWEDVTPENGGATRWTTWRSLHRRTDGRDAPPLPRSGSCGRGQPHGAARGTHELRRTGEGRGNPRCWAQAWRARWTTSANCASSKSGQRLCAEAIPRKDWTPPGKEMSEYHHPVMEKLNRAQRSTAGRWPTYACGRLSEAEFIRDRAGDGRGRVGTTRGAADPAALSGQRLKLS